VNGLLDAVCAVAGGASGFILYDVAARVPPASPSRAASGSGAELDASAVPEVVLADAAPSGRPPLPASPVERVIAAVVTGALLLSAGIRFGPVPALAAFCVLFAGLVALSVTDLRVGLVPRRLLYPWLALVAVGLFGASAAGGDWHRLWVSVACGAAVFAAFFCIWFVFPRGMGFGDVRLAGVLALALGWLGPLHVYIGLMVGFVIGALYGIVTMVVTGRGRRTRFPFAPALSLGAVVSVLWGANLITAWVGHGS
jgi:leader peptidase (prepilin peptidase) / N-methyltransferase